MKITTKTYKIRANNAVFNFSLGKVKVRASFTGGNLGGEKELWATMTTSNPLVHLVIEKDERFGKVIFIERVRVVETDKPKKDMTETSSVEFDKSDVIAESTDKEIVEDVKSLNDLYAFIRERKLDPDNQYTTMAKLKKAIKKWDFDFPNLEF